MRARIPWCARGPSSRAGFSRTSLLVVALLAFVAGLAAGVLGGATLRGWLDLREGEAPAAASAPAAELWTCGMHPQVIQDRPGTCPICGMALSPVSAEGPAADVLAIDPTVVQNMGLRVATVERAPLARRIRAVGVLAEPEPARHDVNLRVAGWIERLYADTEGMRLAQGDPLFELYSPQLQVAIEELIGARRMRSEAGSGARAEALQEAAVRKLELLGVSPARIEELAPLDVAPRTVTFTSPADGYLVEKRVYQGSAVSAGDTVMRVADASTLWLDVRVFEQDLVHVRVGQELSATVDARPGETFAGRVTLVHPRIDPVTRTALVRAEVDNPELELRHGMFATAFLRVEIAPSALVVPREAILASGTRQVAFVALDMGHFEPRRVQMGASGEDGLVQVLSGLAPGEQVVVSGQFLLDAESRMKEAIQRFLQQKSLPLGGAGDEIDGPPAEAAGPLAEVSAEWRRATEQALAAYLDLAGVLGLPQESDQPVDAAALERAAEALRARAASAEQSALAEDLVSAAVALRARPVEEQRALFARVSDAAIALARRSPRTGELVPRLLLAHCPMVSGRWLQAEEEIANPYYATTMKACGEIEQAIPIPGDGDPAADGAEGDDR